MALKPFRKIRTTDKELNLLQDYLEDTLAPLVRCPLVDGRLIRQVSLKAGNNDVSHGLGRNYISWALMNPSAQATVAYGQSPDTTKFFRVNASAPCVADFWVF